VRAWLQGLRDGVRSSLWAVPGLCVLLAVALALTLVRVDRWGTGRFRFTFGAGADGAREVLSAITTAMITFTGLVFSITVVVLQLTSSQFSPRVLRTFLRDRVTQWSLGVFTATFVYAVLVLRTVTSGGDEDEAFVPAVSTTVAVALLLGSVALFISYIHHIATTIQVSAIIHAIGDETRAALERRYGSAGSKPSGKSPPTVPDQLATAQLPVPSRGVVQVVDTEQLVALARRADVVLYLHVRPGDYLPAGAPLLDVRGDPNRLDSVGVLRAITQGRERTLQDDVAFGFRQLVDIADRALSPGFNDPTTAVQVLDELHDLLRRLATRRLPSGVHVDEDGNVRLVVPRERLADYLSLALDEIVHYGADVAQVRERVRALLDDVGAAALPEHRAALDEARRAFDRSFASSA
jgi:uncharacterized membrane protein